MKVDFSGYATKNDVKCSDGRIILKDAFKHNDGETVPLVWQHMHNSPENILGHATLENREDGVYAQCRFNDTPAGQNAKKLVEHGDIKALSIFANGLVEKANKVIHGSIKEVSLVLSGANPEAKIQNVTFAHSDGTEDVDETEAIIFSGETLGEDEEELSHEENDDGKTVADVLATFNEEQQNVLYALLEEVVKNDDSMSQSDDNNEGGQEMKTNVFNKDTEEKTLSHSEVETIIEDGVKMGSLKESILAHAGDYGIENIDVLFPDFKTLTNTPEFDKRRTEWVTKVLNGIRKTPFARIKTMYADITADEARAKGYITGNEKFEEYFPVFKRETDATTIYKKQKLDRDDITDITDFDVVAWLKAEMKLMLDEERARAYLIGDGRLVTDADKIDENKIRPIWKEDDKYAIKKQLATTATPLEELESIVRAMDDYKGSGTPTLFTTRAHISDWKLIKDDNSNYMFRTIQEIADFVGVKEIVDVEPMAGLSRTVEGTDYDLIGIIVNLKDYTSGANKGGKVSMFDDFDIDFNQYKYLLETRCSGALTKLLSAIVLEKEHVAG